MLGDPVFHHSARDYEWPRSAKNIDLELKLNFREEANLQTWNLQIRGLTIYSLCQAGAWICW